MGSLKTAFAIKSLYIFYHHFDFHLDNIGIMPDERRDAVVKAMHSPGSGIETKEVEYEIHRLMINYFT